jgi:hypothetical protein
MAIIKSTLSDGTELMIETDDIIQKEMLTEKDDFRSVSSSVEKIVDSGKNLFHETISRIQLCAAEISTGINNIKEALRPDEVEASLAFKLTAEAGVILTKLSGEAQLTVKLVWKNEKTNKKNKSRSTHEK